MSIKEKVCAEKIIHPIPPLYDENSEILILGSFPSVKSREQMFFYGHPQNRFWRLIAKILTEEEPNTIEEKKHIAIKNHIAMWDVLASCEIKGSADSSIKSVTANDLSPILNTAPIKKIYLNGKTAEKYYIKYIYPKTGIEGICLPSTSPANAMCNMERLEEKWRVIKDELSLQNAPVGTPELRRGQ